jgi:hypothetical protein
MIWIINPIRLRAQSERGVENNPGKYAAIFAYSYEK